MGYRQYFYEVDKKLIKRIRECKTNEEYLDLMIEVYPDKACYKDEDYFPPYKIGKEIFEFGKHYENSEELYKHGDSLFSSLELNERYQDYKPIVIDKEGVMCAIKWQKNKIISIYEDLLKEKSEDIFDHRSQFDRMKEHIEDHLRWWKPEFGDYTAYNLNEASDNLVKSWLYEHNIFDLVRIYKTFDWKNKCIIFLGW